MAWAVKMDDDEDEDEEEELPMGYELPPAQMSEPVRLEPEDDSAVRRLFGGRVPKFKAATE
jgi:hypothetical protein